MQLSLKQPRMCSHAIQVVLQDGNLPPLQFGNDNLTPINDYHVTVHFVPNWEFCARIVSGTHPSFKKYTHLFC